MTSEVASRFPRVLSSISGWRRGAAIAFPREALLPGLPLLGAIGALAVHETLPDKQGFGAGALYSSCLTAVVLGYSALLVGAAWVPGLQARVRHWAPLAAAGFGVLVIWDLTTAKYGLLPLPYFPGPEKVLGGAVQDAKLLGISLLYSLRLQIVGYVAGALLGLVTGTLLGWYAGWRYWLMPVLKLIGPIPATAWIPIAMVVFPTSFLSSIFLITIAVWFPVTVMTSSGIAGVRNAYFEVARTLGADERDLIFRVALPAALPTIFIGLFQGLGVSFVVLIVAEMIGVKAGLGWYLSWTQSWAEFGKFYACLLLIALLFSGLVTLFFRIRDRALVWQKGWIKW